MTKKRILSAGILLFVFVCMLAMSSCSVKSKDQIVRYARQNFGKAELLSTEKLENGGLKCTFKDNQYGFEYYVKSEMHDIIIDGSKFGSVESTSSDFGGKYKDTFIEKCTSDLERIKSKYNVDLELHDSYDFIVLHCKSSSCDYLAAASEIADVIIGFDGRKFFKDSFIGIYTEKDNRLGSYFIHDKKYKTVEEIDRENSILNGSSYYD